MWIELMTELHVQLSRWSFVLQGLLYSTRRNEIGRRGSCRCTLCTPFRSPSHFHLCSEWLKVPLDKGDQGSQSTRMARRHKPFLDLISASHNCLAIILSHSISRSRFLVSPLTPDHTMYGHFRVPIPIRRTRTCPSSPSQITRPAPTPPTRGRTGRSGY